MTKNVVGPKILKKEQVLISIFLIAILVFSSGSMVAYAKSNTHVVIPNGHDDTANIQAAFNACGSTPWCTVQLVKGTYYISQIVVTGFQGTFVGMGQGVTVIQALPDLPQPVYNTPSSPFWSGPPGPGNQWPALFTFVGGSFSISEMTITDPNTAPISSPGWYSTGSFFYPSGSFTALYAAILITGEQQASARIDHVTVLGASGDIEGTNMWNGIVYGGTLPPPELTNYESLTTLISGTFSVTNSVFNSIESGPLVGELNGAKVTVCYNTAVNTPGPTYGFFDAYASTLTYCGNQGSAGMFTTAMIGMQDVSVPSPTGVSPSTVYITNNNLHASQGANAMALGGVPNGAAETYSAVVSGNTFTVDSTCTSTLEAMGECYNYPTPVFYYAAVYFDDLSNVVFSQNTIFGGGASTTPLRVPADGLGIIGGPGTVSGNIITGSYYGMWLDTATSIQVTHNIVMSSANYGIALLDTSSNNVVAHNIVLHSGVDDVYQDLSSTGTGNVWFGNICQTSSPPGLC